MEKGFAENAVIDEGVDENGINTKLIFEGDYLITQKTYDAEPHLKYAEEARIATAGQRWGEGRLVGHLPPAEYARFLKIRDSKERQKQLRAWLAQNSKFVMFDRYLKST